MGDTAVLDKKTFVNRNTERPTSPAAIAENEMKISAEWLATRLGGSREDFLRDMQKAAEPGSLLKFSMGPTSCTTYGNTMTGGPGGDSQLDHGSDSSDDW